MLGALAKSERELLGRGQVRKFAGSRFMLENMAMVIADSRAGILQPGYVHYPFIIQVRYETVSVSPHFVDEFTKAVVIEV